jgi:hypothetical protein
MKRKEKKIFTINTKRTTIYLTIDGLISIRIELNDDYVIVLLTMFGYTRIPKLIENHVIFLFLIPFVVNHRFFE